MRRPSADQSLELHDPPPVATAMNGGITEPDAPLSHTPFCHRLPRKPDRPGGVVDAKTIGRARM